MNPIRPLYRNIGLVIKTVITYNSNIIRSSGVQHYVFGGLTG